MSRGSHVAHRQVEPDDRVGAVEDQEADLVGIAAVDHPAVLRDQRLDLRAQLLRGRLRPVRAVVQGVQLRVRDTQPLGGGPADRRLAARRRAGGDGDPPHTRRRAGNGVSLTSPPSSPTRYAVVPSRQATTSRSSPSHEMEADTGVGGVTGWEAVPDEPVVDGPPPLLVVVVRAEAAAEEAEALERASCGPNESVTPRSNQQMPPALEPREHDAALPRAAQDRRRSRARARSRACWPCCRRRPRRCRARACTPRGPPAATGRTRAGARRPCRRSGRRCAARPPGPPRPRCPRRARAAARGR